MKKAIVPLSAGLDSTTNLYITLEKGYRVDCVLTFDYGQKAAAQEIKYAKKICGHLKLKHEILKLDFFKSFTSSSLISQHQKIPQGLDVDIQSLERSHQTAKSVWVPNRNGIFLNIAAGYAEMYGAQIVVPGFNAEEAATFPDNSEEFAITLEKSFSLSTQNKVRVVSWTQNMQKSEIAGIARKMQIPLEFFWPCYHSEEKPCGQCESCLRDRRAFLSAGYDLKNYFIHGV